MDKTAIRKQLHARVADNLQKRGVNVCDRWNTNPKPELSPAEQERLNRQRLNKKRWARKERAKTKKLIEELKDTNCNLEADNKELKDQVSKLSDLKLQLKSALLDHQCQVKTSNIPSDKPQNLSLVYLHSDRDNEPRLVQILDNRKITLGQDGVVHFSDGVPEPLLERFCSSSVGGSKRLPATLAQRLPGLVKIKGTNIIIRDGVMISKGSSVLQGSSHKDPSSAGSSGLVDSEEAGEEPQPGCSRDAFCNNEQVEFVQGYCEPQPGCSKDEFSSHGQVRGYCEPQPGCSNDVFCNEERAGLIGGMCEPQPSCSKDDFCGDGNQEHFVIPQDQQYWPSSVTVADEGENSTLPSGGFDYTELTNPNKSCMELLQEEDDNGAMMWDTTSPLLLITPQENPDLQRLGSVGVTSYDVQYPGLSETGFRQEVSFCSDGTCVVDSSAEDLTEEQHIVPSTVFTEQNSSTLRDSNKSGERKNDFKALRNGKCRAEFSSTKLAKKKMTFKKKLRRRSTLINPWAVDSKTNNTPSPSSPISTNEKSVILDQTDETGCANSISPEKPPAVSQGLNVTMPTSSSRRSSSSKSESHSLHVPKRKSTRLAAKNTSFSDSLLEVANCSSKDETDGPNDENSFEKKKQKAELIKTILASMCESQRDLKLSDQNSHVSINEHHKEVMDTDDKQLSIIPTSQRSVTPSSVLVSPDQVPPSPCTPTSSAPGSPFRAIGAGLGSNPATVSSLQNSPVVEGAVGPSFGILCEVADGRWHETHGRQLGSPH